MFDVAIGVTVGIFLLGLAYQSGRLSVRVESLEQWRDELRKEIHAIYAAAQRMEDAARARSR